MSNEFKVKNGLVTSSVRLTRDIGTSLLEWDSINGTANLPLYNSINLKLGQGQYIYGKAVEAITKGMAVMLDSSAQGEAIAVRKADMAFGGFDPSQVVGIAAQDISINTSGYICEFGKVYGLNTYGLSVGSTLYLDSTVAGATLISGASKVKIARVIKTASTAIANDGVILVKPEFSNYLSALHDTNISGLESNSLLLYNGSKWINTNANTIKNNLKIQGTTQLSIAVSTSVTTVDMSLADNFILNMGINTTIQLSNISSKIGSTGNFIIKQDAVGGRSFTKASEMKTPLGGAAIDQVTTPNSVSVLGYYVVDATTLLVNYIGNFA